MKSGQLDILHLCTPDHHINITHMNSDLKYSGESMEGNLKMFSIATHTYSGWIFGLLILCPACLLPFSTGSEPLKAVKLHPDNAVVIITPRPFIKGAK